MARVTSAWQRRSSMAAYVLKQISLGIKVSQFMVFDIIAVGIHFIGICGILNQRIDNGKGKICIASIAIVSRFGQDSLSLGIALEATKVVALLCRENFADRPLLVQKTALRKRILKPIPDDDFSKMTKRRIAKVVQKTCA